MNFSSLARAASLAVMKTLTAATLLLILGIQPGIAAADLSRTVEFNIPPQLLPAALLKYSEQSGVQVTSPSEILDGKSSGGVVGSFLARNALERLLTGTELGYDVIDPNTVAIRVAGAADPKRNDSSRTPSTPQALNYPETPGPARKPGFWQRFRLAQNDQSSKKSGSEQQEESPSQSSDKNSESRVIAEVLVTGTHIRGTSAIGAPTITLTREDINRTGYATVQDVLQTIPQNFASLSDQNTGPANVNRGIGANLRGLGPVATLTLVDGRRQPTAGDGSFVDVASIPASAIERIEILTDGASAIYGSDAIGGVVNIILRKDYEGAETQVRFAGAGDLGEAQETLFAQTFGHSWDKANALVGYQYIKRTPLKVADRSFAASADKRRFGGTDLRTFSSNPGNILAPDGSVQFAIPPGQDGRSLTVADLLPASEANRGEPLEGGELLSENGTHSGFFSTSYRATDTLELFADGRYSEREFSSTAGGGFPFPLPVPATHPFNPFGAPVRVAYSLIDDLGSGRFEGSTKTLTATAGLRLDMTATWWLSAMATHGNEKSHSEISIAPNFGQLFAALFDPSPDTALNPFGDGSNTNPVTLALIRSVDIRDSETTLRSYSALAEGPVFNWGAGEARLAVGAEYRDEKLDSSLAVLGIQSPDLARHIAAAFGELALPLLRRNGEAALLEASLAGRYEEYSDFGSTFNPKLGLRFAPLAALALHASWSTSFRAPRLVDVDEIPLNFFQNLPDPLSTSPSGTSNVIALGLNNSSNANLQEETATSWSVGFDLTPAQALPGLELSLSYYDIDYKDRILAPTSAFFFIEALLRPEWSAIVTRDPSSAELAAACAQVAGGNGAAQCAATPPVAIVDFRLRNVAAAQTSGVDLRVGQRIHTVMGELTLGLNGNYVLEYQQQVTAASQVIELLDTYTNPLRLKLRATASLMRGGWSVDAAVNYAGAYENPASVSNPHIGSWTTLDLGLGYRFERNGGILDQTEVVLRAVNAFDEDPPFVNALLGYDSTNARALGRFVSVTVQKSW